MQKSLDKLEKLVEDHKIVICRDVNFDTGKIIAVKFDNHQIVTFW